MPVLIHNYMEKHADTNLGHYELYSTGSEILIYIFPHVHIPLPHQELCTVRSEQPETVIQVLYADDEPKFENNNNNHHNGANRYRVAVMFSVPQRVINVVLASQKSFKDKVPSDARCSFCAVH